ncbi:hypothetical protein GCM10008171_01690 [Methylopila jiangsuensis]|uniref:Uncharacterized protein n=2 Tax=Methylopila jiangsuensis TaxID=586230 RepID=A0A9W6JEF3_9HYPH|nr:hypothetical protein GCM10008171_01690 [Methylopila jiangsuensis]
MRTSKSVGNRFPKEVLDVCPELRVDGRLVDFAEIHSKIAVGGFSYRWKNGGCAWGDEIVEGNASPAPANIIPSKFVDLLDPDTPDTKYFLTANAAVGIIRRADVVGRTLFPPMRAALEAMVKNPTEVVASVTAENAWRDKGAKSSVRPTGANKRGKIETTRASARRALRRAD